MDPATDALPSSSELAGRFYDALAADYDAMTGFEQRFDRERPFFEQLVDRYEIRRAVDAGAGTGFHSLLLAQLGVHVLAVDVSADMLEIARTHAARMGLPVSTVRASLLDFAPHAAVPQDAVFCMGNTLAHLTEPGAPAGALAQFQRVLAPGGILVVQTLNFELIMKQAIHVQNVKEVGGVRFVREYVPSGDLVELRITRAVPADPGPQEKVARVRLSPVYPESLALELSNAGFEEVRFYGSIALDTYDPDRSRDLVVLSSRR